MILRRGRADMLNRATALAFAALVLMTIAATMTMMTVQKAGITHDATLIDGPLELVRRGLWPLAVVVVLRHHGGAVRPAGRQAVHAC